jgi:hypothetical protein
VVGAALAAQARAVEGHGAHVVDGAGVEVPHVGREQPRPADDLAGVERLDHHGAASGRVRRQRDTALSHEIEDVGRLALAEHPLAPLEADVPGAAGDELELIAREPVEDRAFGHELVKCA